MILLQHFLWFWSKQNHSGQSAEHHHECGIEFVDTNAQCRACGEKYTDPKVPGRGQDAPEVFAGEHEQCGGCNESGNEWPQKCQHAVHDRLAWCVLHETVDEPGPENGRQAKCRHSHQTEHGRQAPAGCFGRCGLSANGGCIESASTRKCTAKGQHVGHLFGGEPMVKGDSFMFNHHLCRGWATDAKQSQLAKTEK